MMVSELLPIGQYQPIGFPAPIWLMQTLLLLGFLLHIIPMNIMWMGGLSSAGLLWAGKGNDASYETRLGKIIAYSLPFFATAAINAGIVPLLFVQVLYGPLVYTSSVLMATPWILILPLLVLGYYSFYIYQYGKKGFGKDNPWTLLLSTLLFFVIGFFFTNNMTLMLTPEKFLAMYQHSHAGVNLNLSEPSLWARFSHFALGAVAVTGLYIGCVGLYQKARDAAFSQWLIKRGASIFLGVTLINSVVGVWFLNSLHPDVTAQFLGGTKMATHLFNTAMGLDVISLIAMALAAVRGSVPAFITGLTSSSLLICAMIGMRHLVRVFMTEGVAGTALQEVLKPSSHEEKIQTGVLIIFLTLFVGMIAYFVWLGKTVWKAVHKTEEAA
ncbi:MAG: hypothetical protein ACKO34_02415 [Vampirovibrionales bacterium]